jgi:hypothetical protein
MRFGDTHKSKPYRFIRFGDIHKPKPYRFTGFGDIPRPKPYRFIRFGDIHKPKLYRFMFLIGPGPLEGAYRNSNHTLLDWARPPRGGISKLKPHAP